MRAGGIGSAAGRAIIADSVPVDAATGKPLDPGRDLSIMNYSGALPRVLLPALLGAVFTAFRSRAFAYKAFFLAASVIHLVSSLLYLQVGQAQRAAGVGYTCRAAARQDEAQENEKQQPEGPVVGRACDSMCFRSRRRRSDILSGPKGPIN